MPELQERWEVFAKSLNENPLMSLTHGLPIHQLVRTHPVLKVHHGQNGTDAISVAQRQYKVKALEARLVEHSNLRLHSSLELVLAIDEEENARQVDTVGD